MTQDVAIAGATGHVGSALVDRMVADGVGVRALSRSPGKLRPRDGLTVVEGDLGSADDLLTQGCVAYFLVHGLTAGLALVEHEQELAAGFAAAAERAGASRLVFLGGLVDEHDADLSDHMQGRLAAGRALRASSVPCIEFRASIVIGAGSFSFELIRKLVQVAPLIALPSWTDNLAQPIAVDDVVSYLAAAATVDADADAVVEIGGATQLSYRDLVKLVAELSGATRAVVGVPVPDKASTLATEAAGLVIDKLPGDAQETLRLFESLRHESVVRDHTAETLFSVKPVDAATAVRRALAA